MLFNKQLKPTIRKLHTSIEYDRENEYKYYLKALN
jgi:hypothetical protein